MIIIRYFCSIILFIPTLLLAESGINWLEFIDYAKCTASECALLDDYISEEFIEANEEFESGLTVIMPQAILTSFDFNYDGISDFIISILSAGDCGSAGCSTFMLLSNGKKYSKILLPHSYAFQSKNAIGLKSDELIFESREGYGVWKMEGNQFMHLKNIKR